MKAPQGQPQQKPASPPAKAAEGLHAFEAAKLPKGLAPIDSFSELNAVVTQVKNGEPSALYSQSRAKTALSQRSEILTACAPLFQDVADKISQLYVFNMQRGSTEGNRIRSGLTRFIHTGLMAYLPEAVQNVWKHFHLEVKEYPQGHPLLRVFGWAYNKMMRLDESEGRPDLAYISRGKIGGEPAHYSLHTHVDVPLFLEQYGLNTSLAALALAACHDAFEEGLVLRFIDGAWTMTDVDLNELSTRFPEDNLGYKLAVGIAALTETPEEELLPKLRSDSLLVHTQLLDELRSSNAQMAKLSEKDFQKIHFSDPLVFGGLALQVCEVVGEIAALEHQTSDRELSRELWDTASAIVSVEICDRMSDIASLDRHVEWYKDDPFLGRYKTVAYVSRMLNMHEALTEAIAEFPEELQSHFNDAMQGYLHLIKHKLNDVNALLEKEGQPGISLAELEEFYREIFTPIQQSANALQREAVCHKVQDLMRFVADTKLDKQTNS